MDNKIVNKWLFKDETITEREFYGNEKRVVQENTSKEFKKRIIYIIIVANTDNDRLAELSYEDISYLVKMYTDNIVDINRHSVVRLVDELVNEGLLIKKSSVAKKNIYKAN